MKDWSRTRQWELGLHPLLSESEGNFCSFLLSYQDCGQKWLEKVLNVLNIESIRKPAPKRVCQYTMQNRGRHCSSFCRTVWKAADMPRFAGTQFYHTGLVLRRFLMGMYSFISSNAFYVSEKLPYQGNSNINKTLSLSSQFWVRIDSAEVL